ncbi:MAG: hypothetical protein KAT70_05040, partial [Thermoplasmata archaeon]|nr:hypothetical protein [Thermoplasmata archaeon]
ADESTATPQIELHNRNGTSVELNNWFFSPVKDASIQWPIDLGVLDTIIDGGYKLVGPPDITGLAMPAQGGSLYLFDPTGLFGDVIHWGHNGSTPDPIDGESASRAYEIDHYALDWTRDETPTWGALNDAPAPELGEEGVYINEVKTGPGGFVELYSDGGPIWQDDMEYLLATPNPTPTTPFHGWNHSGANDCWQHGTPYWSTAGTSGDDEADDDGFGPTTAYSGDHCWGTNLQGDYLNNTGTGTELVASLRSPDRPLGADVSDASIRFYDWLDLQDSPNDYCNVSVYRTGTNELLQVLEPSGYNLDHEWEFHDYPLSFSLSLATIYVRFDLYADETGETAGWFIDDFEIHTNNVSIEGWQIVADGTYAVPADVSIGSTGTALTCYLVTTNMAWGDYNVYLFDDVGILRDMVGWHDATQGSGTIARVDDGSYGHIAYNETMSVQDGWDMDHLESMDAPNWMPYSIPTAVGTEHLESMPDDPMRDWDYERDAYHMTLEAGEKYYIIFQEQTSYYAGYDIGWYQAPDLTATDDNGLVLTLPDGGSPVANSTTITPAEAGDHYFRLEGESDYCFVVHNETTMTNLYQGGTGAYY